MKSFLTQFLSGWKRKRTLTYLLSLRQGDIESLKDHIHRFNQVKLTVEDVPKNLVLVAVLNGLSPKGPFILELGKKTPVTLQEFMDKAKAFVSLEEAMNAFVESKGEKLKNLGKKESHKVKEAHRRTRYDSRSANPWLNVNSTLPC